MNGDTADPRTVEMQDALVRASVMSRLFGASASAPRVGRYRMLEHLGSGAMGTVWSAYDRDLDRRIAVELLHDAADDRRDDERALREARTMASIKRAHVYEVGAHDDGVYIAMEFVDGPTPRPRRARRSRMRPLAPSVAFETAGRDERVAERRQPLVRDGHRSASLVVRTMRRRRLDATCAANVRGVRCGVPVGRADRTTTLQQPGASR
jgi:hypothetical protein